MSENGDSSPDQARPVSVVEGHEAMRAALIEVIGQAQRRLLILSQCLESGLYKDAAVVEAVKQQALNNPRLEIKLIVSEPKQAIQQAEPLVELGRRLSSKFNFREPVSGKHQFDQDSVVADRSAYFYRDRPDNLFAKHGQHDPVGAHDLIEDFNSRWRNSQPAAEFRRLS